MKKLICHCGAVEAEINLDGDLSKVIKCNCSICKRKGATDEGAPGVRKDGNYYGYIRDLDGNKIAAKNILK